jgi:hypothetical protein
MSTRNRLNEKEMCRLTGGLFTVLRNTVDYLDVPLTNKQMAEVWHTGLPTEIKEAYSLLDTAGYSQSIHSRVVVCHVPELKMLVRLMDRDQEQIFLIAPNDGPFKVKSFRTHQGLTRKVPLTDFETVLPRETYDDFLTWASAAAKCEERQIEARDTIDAIIKMLSTAGQLRRMVPELMQYLPADIQK